MGPKDNGHVEGFKESLEAWTDHRFVSREDIEALAMFVMYIVNLADAGGWLYRGHSFRMGVGLSTLVVKAMLDDTAVVCFVSGKTFVNCVRIFLRKLDEDVVEWRQDKYA